MTVAACGHLIDDRPANPDRSVHIGVDNVRPGVRIRLIEAGAAADIVPGTDHHAVDIAPAFGHAVDHRCGGSRIGDIQLQRQTMAGPVFRQGLQAVHPACGCDNARALAKEKLHGCGANARTGSGNQYDFVS